MTQFSFEMNNNLIKFPQIGNLDTLALQLGQLQTTGQFSCYFADAAYLDKFLAWEDTSIVCKLGGATSKNYTWLFSRVKITQPSITQIGVNQAIILQCNWEALTDPTHTSVQLTRSAT